MPRGGKSSKRKGTAGEREAAKVLNRYLTGGLEARRVPGSGALSFRRDHMDDPHFAGDIQIRLNGRILEYVEVKRAKPGAITIATMDRWREHRRLLMCRQDRGDWIASMWARVWDEWNEFGARQFLRSMSRCYCDYQDVGTRGVRLPAITSAIHTAQLAVLWGAAFYMSPKMLAEMLTERYGE